jgi:HSP20 family molecular chaperone IbpA
MALFAHGLYDPIPSFTPLFRLLDEFDNYTREVHGTHTDRPRHRNRGHHNSFNPRFDVRETENAYELYGELPGIDRENISIEFTDPQTLVIRGRTERTYISGTPPAGLLENGNQLAGAITENGEEQTTSAAENNGTEKGKEKAKAPSTKYWLQERSVGEFARTFGFPTRVDQDAVTASLNNGILTLVVPKAKKHETRRITIN